MPLSLPPTFKLQVVTKADLAIASIAWGFTLGFGFLTTWTAIKQTRRTKKRNSPYIWMIWLEIVISVAFSVICWMHLYGVIPPSFAFYFSILTCWALQVQFLLQIIINRVMVLMTNRRAGRQIRLGVAVLITAVNISVYNIWIPARMQISHKYISINTWWDRCEKIIYLLVDAALNILFIRTVHQNLVKNGLSKYKTLVRFNSFIIIFSLSMDVLIITTMSLRETFVYMQFHPLAYIVKLKIEMSMAELITKVARSQDTGITSDMRASNGHNFSLGYHRSATNKTNVTTRMSAHELANRSKRRSRIESSPEGNVYSATATSRSHNAPESAATYGERGDWQIYATREVEVAYGNVQPIERGESAEDDSSSEVKSKDNNWRRQDDEVPLR